ncbi:hypothetical protein B0H13DRAFT_2236194 [Mycena leptocephala]|nr:hypothetical protein B0H13DRAFT_2236194 [Mycena leptocephala]
MNPAALNHPCLVCGRPTSQWCSRCRAAFYCSPEHLQSDWPHHRERCRHSAPYVSNMIVTLPSVELDYVSVSAIFFLTDEDRPKMITLRCRSPHRPRTPYFDAPPDSIVLTQNLSGELLRFPLHVFYSPTALTKGPQSAPWCGNVVALKFSGSRRQGYTEASSNDLPALSAYFLSYK